MTLESLWSITRDIDGVALSGNGQVLLTRSTQRSPYDRPIFHLTSTYTGSNLQPEWTIDNISRPSVFSMRGAFNSSTKVTVQAMALDRMGTTAVIAFTVGSENTQNNQTTIRVWNLEEGVSTTFERTVKEVDSVDVLRVSPGGDYFAIVYTVRHVPRIEIVRILGEKSRHRFFTIGGWRERQGLRPGASITFSELDGFIAVAAWKEEEVYVVNFDEPVANPNMVTFDGEEFVSVNVYKGRHFLGLSGIKPCLRVESFEFSPDSKEFALATSQELTIWNTLSKRGFHRKLVSSKQTKPGSVSMSYSPPGDQIAISASEVLWMMDAAYFNCFRQLELPDLGKHHVLCFCNKAIHIISTVHGTLNCYKLPYSIIDDFTQKGAPLDLSDKIELTNNHVGGGGFGDVFKATWKSPSIVEPPEVAVKVVRAPSNRDPVTMARRHAREIEVWKRVKHENIVPFLGIIFNGLNPSLVSQWMPNGTCMDFLSRYPDYNRIEIIDGVGNGLKFLHSREPVIIHGDMKGANVLIDAVGSPRIIDFGISRLVDPSTLWNTNKSTADGSMRWMSPELLTGDEPLPTSASDVYAFAMTAVEILTGEVPFAKTYPRNEQVMFNVVTKNARPERPSYEGCSDALWELLQICWNSHPQQRWSMDLASNELKNIVGRLNPLRILTIDHSYSRMSAAFGYLRKIESELEIGSNIGSHFDLICGSSFGGFIALLLGILSLNVDECHAEYWALCLVFREIAKKRDIPYILFAWEHLYDSSIESHLEDLIIRYGLDPSALLSDFQFTRPRVMLIANTWRRIPSQRRSYRTPEDLPWETITLHAAFMHSLALPGGHVCINPAELALQEARHIYGSHREIGCFISCGLGHTISGSPTTPMGNHTHVEIPRVRSRLKYIRVTGAILEETHLKVAKELGDAYFRFDVKDHIEMSWTTELTKVWATILDAQDWRILQLLGDLSKRYMALPGQAERVSRCVSRLGERRMSKTNWPMIASAGEMTESTWNGSSQSSTQSMNWLK